MAAASCLLTEDQFLCSICLDVFTDPVSIPCGHNFCKTCITLHWDVNVTCQCPNCNKVYLTRPELQINTFISEMAAQFRRSALQKTTSSSSDQQVVQPGEVLCDICTELKAVKSCLVCLTSYCETHLEPHLTKSGLKRHQLIERVKNLEERLCKKHDKLLELFCKTDQMCVCVLCTCSDHKTHEVVHLKEEFEEKKTELEKTEAEIHQMIQKREQKIQEIKLSVELSNKYADRELEEGVQVFTALKESIERSQAELIKTIKQKQRTTEKQAEDFIKELEQEIFDLKKRSSEVEQLSQSEDHLCFLQRFSSLNTAPPTKDWTEVSIRQPSYEGSVVRAVDQLEKSLSEQMKKVFEVELARVQQFAEYVFLKPMIVIKQLFTPSNQCRCALSVKGFRSGKFYFEVEVKGWSRWTLGVTRTCSIEREIMLSPRNGYWTLCGDLRGGYSAAADPSVLLSLKSHPEMVGVFVDYEQGLVSFYDTDTTALIYSFTGCTFTQNLYAFFSPCCNDGAERFWWSFFLREHKLYLQT